MGFAFFSKSFLRGSRFSEAKGLHLPGYWVFDHMLVVYAECCE